MLVGSAPDPPAAVFYDPTGRRRQVLHMLFITTVSVAAVVLTLLIIGLAGGGHPPRAFVGRGPAPAGPDRVRQGPTASRSSLSRPAGLPALPALPSPEPHGQGDSGTGRR